MSPESSSCDVGDDGSHESALTRLASSQQVPQDLPMGWLRSRLMFPVSWLILVWVAGSGKSPPLIHSLIHSANVY